MRGRLHGHTHTEATTPRRRRRAPGHQLLVLVQEADQKVGKSTLRSLAFHLLFYLNWGRKTGLAMSRTCCARRLRSFFCDAFLLNGGRVCYHLHYAAYNFMVSPTE